MNIKILLFFNIFHSVELNRKNLLIGTAAVIPTIFLIKKFVYKSEENTINNKKPKIKDIIENNYINEEKKLNLK